MSILWSDSGYKRQGLPGAGILPGIYSIKGSGAVYWPGLGNGMPAPYPGSACMGLDLNNGLGNSGTIATVELEYPLGTKANTAIIISGVFYAGALDGYLQGFTFSDASDNVIVQVALPKTSSSQVKASLNGTHAPNGASLAGTNLTSGVSNPVILIAGYFYTMEAKLIVGNPGSIEVRVAGQVVYTYSGNTQGTAGSVVGYAGFFFSSICNGSNRASAINGMAGFIVQDTTGSSPNNSFLSIVGGPMGGRVADLMPISDTGTIGWTPTGSVGTNASIVGNHTFVGDSAYVFTSTTGVIDLYNIGTISANLVLDAIVEYVAREDNSGIESIAGLIDIGGTTLSGATNTLTVNYENYWDRPSTIPTVGQINGGSVSIGLSCVS